MLIQKDRTRSLPLALQCKIRGLACTQKETIGVIPKQRGRIKESRSVQNEKIWWYNQVLL